MLPSLEASKKEDVAPSALPTIFSVENEEPELAELRADTSIQKTVLSKTLPNAKDMMPNVEIIRSGNE